MPRPHKQRNVCEYSEGVFFKVRGVPLSSCEIIGFQLDELEAIRLAHLEKMTQEQGAESMGISRSTFGRILERAHEKLTEALINQYALKIEGGPVKMKKRHFSCRDCGKKWEKSFGSGRPEACPECGSNNFHRIDTGPRNYGQGRHGHCGQRGKTSDIIEKADTQ